MASEVSNAVLEAIKPGQVTLVVESTGARIPIVQRLKDVKQALAMSASACIVVEEQCVLIWSNEPKSVLNVAHNVEKQLFGFVSQTSPSQVSAASQDLS